MDLIQSYEEEDEAVASSPESSPPRMLKAKSSAPEVDDTALALTVANVNQSKSKPIDPTQHVVFYNPTHDQLWAPMFGPAHPYAKDGIAQGMRNHKLGSVEDASIGSFGFEEQYHTFHKCGYAADPSGMNYVGDVEAFKKNDGLSVFNIPQSEQKRRKIERSKEEREGEEKKEEIEPEAENPETEAWLRKNRKSPWSRKKEVVQGELTEEQKKYAEDHAKKKEEKGQQGETKGEHYADKSTFHGKEEKDYQGRSWIEAPKDAKANNDHCYIPKRLVHTWSGHKVFPLLGSSQSKDICFSLQVWIVRLRFGMCITLVNV